MKFYTGIGSRSTPMEIQQLMTQVACALALEGWVLRSGCAPGADTAFELGALWPQRDPKPELYTPWAWFEDRDPELCRLAEPQPEAYVVAEEFHPGWRRLSRGGRALHARNVHQVYGPDVTAPVLSQFIICWTEGAQGRGGTGQALRIARHHEIPVFDLCDPEAVERVRVMI